MPNSNHLYQLRLASGFTLTELSGLADMTRSMIYYYESVSITRVPADILIRLADCYQMTCWDILFAAAGQEFSADDIYLVPPTSRPPARRCSHLLAYRNMADCFLLPELAAGYQRLDLRGKNLVTELIRRELRRISNSP